MMQFLAAVALSCLTALSAFAAERPQTDSNAQQAADVLVELSWRSGIREAELSRLLANCNANPQSLYLCAWRNQIATDRALGSVLADKALRRPECRATIENRIADWARLRDASCERRTREKWGDGPIAPTARLRCIEEETARMTSRLARARRCDLQ
jgi:uncharacterized protein YecT (DUF1311 family)